MKKMRSYRLDNYLIEEVKKICKITGMTETKIVEIALIEKLQRMKGDK